MRNAFGSRLAATSYLLFLGFYVYAAAAYGLTRDAPLRIFEFGMGGTLVLWATAHLLIGRFPRIGAAPWIAVGLVLGYGWFLTFAGFLNDAVLDGQFTETSPWRPPSWLIYWGSHNAALSLPAMVRTSVLLGSMLLAIDLWNQPRWARALLLTLVFSSSGMVLFFLMQRVFGGSFQLRGIDDHTLIAFATYRYWGNAASYLNLFWPVTAAVAIFVANRQSPGWALWIIPAAAIFFANFLNVSKAGNVLAVFGAILLLLLLIPICRREWKRLRRPIPVRYLLVALIPILVIAGSIPLALPWDRWEHLSRTASTDPKEGRTHAYRTFLKMLPDSGWSGLGPGTFSKYYRRYVKDDPALRDQPYWVAHQDYIQTAVEWGYLGTILWGLLLVPPTFATLRNCFKRSERPPRDFPGYRIGLFDHVAAFLATVPGATEPALAVGVFTAIFLTALHALVDFPMQIASLQLYFLVLIALGWSYLGRNQGNPIEQTDQE